MSKKTDLYRHFDADGELLYVGISLSAIGRLSQHKSTAHWADKIASVTVESFSTREQAVEAERIAIETEQPLHNKIFNGSRAAPPAVPDEFSFSVFEDDGEVAVVVLGAEIHDLAGDSLVAYFEVDGSVTLEVPALQHLEVNSSFFGKVSDLIDIAVDWYYELERVAPDRSQMQKAYGHLPPSHD